MDHGLETFLSRGIAGKESDAVPFIGFLSNIGLSGTDNDIRSPFGNPRKKLLAMPFNAAGDIRNAPCANSKDFHVPHPIVLMI